MIDRGSWPRRCGLIGMLVVTGAQLACSSLVERTGITWFDRESPHPEKRSYLDEAYVRGSSADPRMHRLDFHLPEPGSVPPDTQWPVLIFLRDAGWTNGEAASGTDPSGIDHHIGRFFASQGVGTAMVSYRSHPDATWPEQVDDIGRASRYVRDRVAKFGGDPDRLFLAGQADGAQLAARFGLGPMARQRAGVDPCGLILVSGVGYDRTDEVPAGLDENRTYFEESFVESEADDWESHASVIELVETDSPPALIVSSAGEPGQLGQPSQQIARAYSEAHAPAWTALVPGEDHERIVLSLSRQSSTAGPAMLDFIQRQTCGVPVRD